MHILLSTYSSNPAYNGDCDIALVEINPEDATLYLTKMGTVADLKAHDGDVVDVRYWDYRPELLPYDAAEGLCDALDGDFMCVADRPNTPEDVAQRLDCCYAVVSEDEVHWKAIPKHCDLYVDTASVSRETLLAIAEGREDQLLAARKPSGSSSSTAGEAKEERDSTAKRDLACDECGEPMAVVADGVSTHLTEDDAVDYDRDADHAAYTNELDGA